MASHLGRCGRGSHRLTVLIAVAVAVASLSLPSARAVTVLTADRTVQVAAPPTLVRRDPSVLSPPKHEAPISPSTAVVRPPFAIYPMAMLLVVGFVTFLYAPRGAGVVIGVLVYVLSQSTIKLTLKEVFTTCGFTFPKAISAMHFMGNALAMAGVLAVRHGLRSSSTPLPVPTKDEFLRLILPISVAISVSIGVSNMALVFCSAAFTEVMGATNCLLTIPMLFFVGLDFNPMLALPASLVAFGCILSTEGELHFSAEGVVLCLLANVFRSGKVTLQQKLMTGESREKFDPCSLLLWSSMPCVCWMLCWSFATDGLEPLRFIARLEVQQRHWLYISIGLSCLNAMTLNLAQLFVTKHLGAVGSQLIAQAKSVLTILGGMAVFKEQVTEVELVGFAVVLFGVYLFARLEEPDKRQAPSGSGMLKQQPVTAGK
mmetsp:Transcript_14001/g.30960  ORF Transcript_14001/g.30960 Transcript_14001/m.30960 type:complete len:430 (-) Transcript_14001:64-1353(-)